MGVVHRKKTTRLTRWLLRPLCVSPPLPLELTPSAAAAAAVAGATRARRRRLQGYPTWEINGALYPGEADLAGLQAILDGKVPPYVPASRP